MRATGRDIDAITHVISDKVSLSSDVRPIDSQWALIVAVFRAIRHWRG